MRELSEHQNILQIVTCRSNNRNRNDDECGDPIYEIVDIVVVNEKEFDFIPGNEEVIGVEGEKTVLTLRTTAKPKECRASYDDGDEIVVKDRSNEQCENNYMKSKSKVCLKKYQVSADGINACHLVIDKMDPDLEALNGN